MMNHIAAVSLSFVHTFIQKLHLIGIKTIHFYLVKKISMLKMYILQMNIQNLISIIIT